MHKITYLLQGRVSSGES